MGFRGKQKDNQLRAAQDSVTAVAAGSLAFLLSREPLENSEHLYVNGLYQPATEWTRTGLSVTVPSTLGLLADDVVTVEYLHTATAAASSPFVVSGSSQSLDGWTMPAAAQDGDLILCLAMLADADTVSDAQGFLQVLQTAKQAHAASTGIWSARLEVWAKIKAAGSAALPVLNDGRGQSVCTTVTLTGPGGVGAAQSALLADGTDLAAPALTPAAQIRMWGAIGPSIDIHADSGTVLTDVGGGAQEDFSTLVVSTANVDAIDASDVAGKSAAWFACSLYLSA